MRRKTHEISVSVETTYLPDQSLPEQQRYAFAYTITISNTGAVAATLLGRHWIITDANGKVQEVRGRGVVGE
ncbi:MAG: ApaG domain, partial [Gammaproteobacteria bacterium]